jgi:hypothetical protein
MGQVMHSPAVDLERRHRYVCPTAFSTEFQGAGAQMSTFDKREQGFEAKFARDQELQFKATARRNRLLGLWAAEKLGLEGTEAEAYAKTVVSADFAEPGEEDVFRKVRADFDAKKVDQSDHQIRRTMQELMARAVEQIENAQT